MSENLENINPKLYKKLDDREITVEEQDEDVADEFDAREIFGKYPNLKLIFNQKYIELLIYFCSRKIFLITNNCYLRLLNIKHSCFYW